MKSIISKLEIDLLLNVIRGNVELNKNTPANVKPQFTPLTQEKTDDIHSCGNIAHDAVGNEHISLFSVMGPSINVLDELNIDEKKEKQKVKNKD